MLIERLDRLIKEKENHIGIDIKGQSIFGYHSTRTHLQNFIKSRYKVSDLAFSQLTEQFIYDFIHSGAAVKSIVLRYFNPIGAHPSALIGELPNGVPNNLIPYVTQTAMGIREQLTIFGNDYDTPDGTCIRDYIYVVDLAKAHVAAMARVLDQETEPIEYFNIGTGKGNSTLEIVTTFEEATGVKLNWKYGPRREGDIEKIWGDCTKANQVLGWKADTPLADVLRSAWKWQEKLREDGVM